ncbi:MAG: GTP-binding protein [Firmicutes bacterium]|nr:GTP-binding protein [Bacillota bacterium]
MKRLVIGIVSHVDAGKTILSESLLYLTGQIRKLGRVDKQDVFLDTHELERARGITIFSKQALLNFADMEMTLLDTPGHVDFSAEMERTLQVLDYVILVISAADGVQAHTRTLWRLLARYKRPVFLFINKMDQPGTDKKTLLHGLKEQLSEGCLDFSQEMGVSFLEELALCQDSLLESYLENGTIDGEQIAKAILARKVFPCYFGSALKLEGVTEFMQGLARYTSKKQYSKEFGAQVFKISRDEQGQRLTHLKITGGSLQVKDTLKSPDGEEKVDQIRLYSGEKYQMAQEALPGMVCTVTGPVMTRPGDFFGKAQAPRTPILEPVLSYQILLPEGYEAQQILPQLQEIEEEHPELRIRWHSGLKEIQAQLMGDIQIEILQSLIETRFGLNLEFGPGKILYKETIQDTEIGVGHFEPLRHYAEVQLLLEPNKRGSGITFATKCSEDELARNWQRLILSHLEEKEHVGVLTGSPITDLTITLVAGRAHNEHTQGGDFREATYRAVRHGLKRADSILLEPYYYFELEVPETSVGRALTDLERMYGEYKITKSMKDMTLITGTAPVSAMGHYQREVTAYTRGLGRLTCNVDGYRSCHNADQVISNIGYDSERDTENPTGSIFFSHGTSLYVNWDEVEQYMHLESYLKTSAPEDLPTRLISKIDYDDEIDYALLERTVSGNWGKKKGYKAKKENTEKRFIKPDPRESYLLIDGYNMIHAWPEFMELANGRVELARDRLLNTLASYGEIVEIPITVVFDAYRVPKGRERTLEYLNLQVVFTKEGQTADQYIEKFAYENSDRYRIRLATSDALQQIVARAAGCIIVSAREFKDEVQQTITKAIEDYNKRLSLPPKLQAGLSKTAVERMLKLKKEWSTDREGD